MNTLNTLFRKRIGFAENEMISFEQLDQVLEKTALSIPFENLCIIAKKTDDITNENLIDKILIRGEGGLCYELNTILYLFLLDNGFDVVLLRGIVYDHEKQDYAAIGRTHVTVLLTYQHQKYIVDTGFGGNLPLKPVPLNGDTVLSMNGKFRISKTNSIHGDHQLEMKLAHKDRDWKTGYAFYEHKPVYDLNELNEVKSLICESPFSSFNKGPLVTRLTGNGHITLTDTSFTQLTAGKVVKETIDLKRFKELAYDYFQLKNN